MKPEDKKAQPTRNGHPPWDKAKARALASKGVGPADIAEVVGVHRTTVSAYLQRAMPEFKALHTFQHRLGDSLMLSVATLTDIESKLLMLLNDEDFLRTLSNGEKERLLGKVIIAKAINFDKWRLHEGKSTSNNSHQIQVQQAHDLIQWGPTSPELSGKTERSTGKDL